MRAERVSIEEALQAYTEFGAFSQKQERVKGRLVPGYARRRRRVLAQPADRRSRTRS